MSREEVYEEVRKILKRLVDESDEETVVLVEGVRDVRTLRKMGFRGRIILQSRLRTELIRVPPTTRVILLLDFDREGMKNTARLYKQLTGSGYRVDDSYHRRLRVLKKLGINTVEAIESLLTAL
ncbi:MAG: toprim domain-containing protein [Candidatus Caldarchaeum sp.]